MQPIHRLLLAYELDLLGVIRHLPAVDVTEGGLLLNGWFVDLFINRMPRRRRWSP